MSWILALKKKNDRGAYKKIELTPAMVEDIKTWLEEQRAGWDMKLCSTAQAIFDLFKEAQAMQPQEFSVCVDLVVSAHTEREAEAIAEKQLAGVQDYQIVETNPA
jgi:hypothetical protein